MSWCASMGTPAELNALSNTAAQLSAAFDQRYNLLILPLVSPLADTPNLAEVLHRRHDTLDP